MPLLKPILIRYGKKKINNINSEFNKGAGYMDREFKKEWLIKALNEDGKLIDIFYNIARGYFDSKGRKIKNAK